jgi:hypothetical protein
VNVSVARKNKYAEVYFNLLLKTLGGRNLRPWLELHNKHATSIEEKLVLIHPDFWGEGLGLNRNARANCHPLGTTGTRDFAAVKKRKECSTNDCNFQFSFPRFESGHIWPDSLGGPAVPENGVCQCYTCNRMQSHSIVQAPWDEWDEKPPLWLKMMLTKLANKIP